VLGDFIAEVGNPDGFGDVFDCVAVPEGHCVCGVVGGEGEVEFGLTCLTRGS
jgi:hypothetical protein